MAHYLSSPASDGSVSVRGWEVYPASGAEDYFEPAFAIQHNDENMTSILYYKSHEVKDIDGNAKETIIKMANNVYLVKIQGLNPMKKI